MPAKSLRLLSVTLIALGVLTIACLSLLRLVLSLVQWQFLSTLEGVSPFYQALTGLVWSVTGFLLSWGLWRRKPWARMAAVWWTLLYALYYWLDRLFLAGLLKSGEPPSNLAFAACVTVMILAFVFWTLSRPKVKMIFGELHE
jgi:hypothetical protein